jgi:hypothetical protein
MWRTCKIFWISYFFEKKKSERAINERKTRHSLCTSVVESAIVRILIEQLCPGISWQDPVLAIGGAASYFTEKQ